MVIPPFLYKCTISQNGGIFTDAVAKKDTCAIQISTQAAHELVLLACAVLKKISYQGTNHLTFIVMGVL